MAVVLLAFAAALTWGLRGIGERAHEPGTQYMNRPTGAGRTRRARRDSAR